MDGKIAVPAKQAAAMLSVSLPTLHKLRESGRVKAVAVNQSTRWSKWLFDVESLKAFARGMEHDSNN